MTRSRRFVLCGLVVAVGVLAAGGARAQNGARVSVRSFTGPHAEIVRRSVVRVLSARNEVSLVPRADVKVTAERVGVADNGDWIRIAREHELNAFVEGRVERRGGGWRARVRVREGRSGEVVATLGRSHRFGRTLVRRIRRVLWASLEDDLVSARPPAPKSAPQPADASRSTSRTDNGEPSTSEEPQKETSTGEDAGRSDSVHPTALRVAAGIALFTRKLRFTDDLFQDLPNYRLSAAPAGMISVGWFPGAHFTDGIAASFGLVAHWSRAFALDSVPQDGGPKRDTKRQILEMGVRWQQAFGRVAPLVEVAYGRHDFDVSSPSDGDSNTPSLEVPFATYLYLRMTAGAAVELGPLVVDAKLGWLHLFEIGELDDADWFPRADGAGAEVTFGVGYPHPSGFEVRVAGRFRRYFFSLHPEPGDPRVAGGAVDQSFAARLELAWNL